MRTRDILRGLLLSGIIASHADAQLTSSAKRADLAYLGDVWATHDKSFSSDAHAAFLRVVADIAARCDTLTDADFNLEIARAVAIARNGHTVAFLGPYFHPLPFRAAWFSDGLFVVSADPAHRALLGARITRLGILTTDEALRRVGAFIPGTESRVREQSPIFLRLVEVLHRIGAITDGSAVPVTVVTRDGTTRTDTLIPGRTPETHFQDWPVLIPKPRDVRDRWPHILDAVSQRPLIYQDPVSATSAWLGASHRILYMRSNRVDSDTKSALDNIVGGEIVPHRPHAVIVDLRLNPGGDYFNTILFAQELPRLLPPGGRIFVLVGPTTFSAALVTAAMLKGQGGDRVALVGEPMGDNPRFVSEGQPIPLPNSQILVNPATGFQDWANGCDDIDRCFWPNVVFGKKGISLDPSIRIAPRFADYASGRDPVLERVLALAGSP